MGKGLRGPGTRREEALAALANAGHAPSGEPAAEPEAPDGDAPPVDPPADPPADPDHPMLASDLHVPGRTGHAPVRQSQRVPGVTHQTSRQRRIVVRTQPLLTDGQRTRRRPRPPRTGPRPVVGLPLLVLLGVLALFVSWVSAEPFWLAVGHQDSGAVEITRCTGRGDLGTRCVGTFSAASREYAVDLATVTGADTADRTVGRRMPARMVSEQGRIAYVGDTAGLHVRWLVGLVLLLVIGFGIAVATGAWRFRGARRTGAVVSSVLAPFLLAGVVLALTY